MASTFKETDSNLPNSVLKDDEYRQADEHSKVLEADFINFSAILRGACQANRGNWKVLIANAIAAREMDPRSVDAWKRCARAALLGGDVDAALDSLLDAMHINHNDREAFTILRDVVEDHLNRTLEVR